MYFAAASMRCLFLIRVKTTQLFFGKMKLNHYLCGTKQ